MKITSTLLTAAAASMLAVSYGPGFSQDGSNKVPPLVGQINNGNWLDKAEAESLLNDLYYQRAIYAYMTMLPAMNTI